MFDDSNCLEASLHSRLIADFVKRVVLARVTPAYQGSGAVLLIKEQAQALVQVVTNVLHVLKISFSVIVTGLKYFSCYCQTAANLSFLNLLRLLVASLICAAKFLDDNTFSNVTWSTVTRLPLEEINAAELELLKGIAFDLHIVESDYRQWLSSLICFVASSAPSSPVPSSLSLSSSYFLCQQPLSSYCNPADFRQYSPSVQSWSCPSSLQAVRTPLAPLTINSTPCLPPPSSAYASPMSMDNSPASAIWMSEQQQQYISPATAWPVHNNVRHVRPAYVFA